MVKLQILAEGASNQAQNQARGKLFEDVMREVLRRYQFKVTNTAINLAGIEIDIVGADKVSGYPLYGECKCYASPIDNNMFGAFISKYVERWSEDGKAVGLFIALPALNSHAKGRYQREWEKHKTFTVRLLEEEQIIAGLIDASVVASADAVRQHIPMNYGGVNASELLYTEHGFFWVLHTTPLGSLLPKHFVLFDGKGQPLTDTATIEYVNRLVPDLANWEQVFVPTNRPRSQLTNVMIEGTDKTIDLTAALKGLSPHTQRAYKSHITKYLTSINRMDERTIDPKHLSVQMIIDSLSSSNLRNWLRRRAKRVGKKSLDQAKSAIVWLAELMKDERYIGEVKATAIKRVNAPIASAGRQRTDSLLTRDEITELLRALHQAKSRNPALAARNFAIITLTVTCGLHRAEIAGTNWSNLVISGSRGEIRLSSQHEEKRLVTLADVSLRALDEWKAFYPRPEGNDPIFTRVWKNGVVSKDRITDRAIWAVVREAGKIAGLPGISPASLRKSFEQAMEEAGLEAKDALIKMFGEKDI